MFSLLLSCEGAVTKPENLVSKSDMALVIKDFALNDQAAISNVSANMTEGTRFILKKYNISAKDFTESYKYYVVKNQMDGILQEAQDILVEEEPRLKQNNVDKKDVIVK